MKINGTLDLAGYNVTVEGLSGRGLVTTSVPGLVTLRVDTTGQSSTFSGVIEDGAGRLGLTTVGTGMLTLRGTNTFTGETTVEAGSTLRLWEFRTDSCQKCHAESKLMYDGQGAKRLLPTVLLGMVILVGCKDDPSPANGSNDFEIRVRIPGDGSAKYRGSIRVDNTRWTGGKFATFLGPSVEFGQVVSLVDHSGRRHGYVVFVVGDGERNVYVNWGFWELERPVRMLFEVDSRTRMLEMEDQGAEIISVRG